MKTIYKYKIYLFIMKSLFTEKYNPKNINELDLQDTLISKIENFIQNKSVPNMILVGPPGTGKTSTLFTIARKIYPDNYDDVVIKYSASDNRGLEIINNNIIYFCKKKISGNNNTKLVIMDEADTITKKAQNAINNLIEEFGESTKFVFTCNDSTKIIESIQSRCIILYFPPILPEKIYNKLKIICTKRKIDYTEDGLQLLVNNANGDIRRAVNNLESVYFGYKKINKENIDNICHQPKADIIISLINSCVNKNVYQSIKMIDDLKSQGYCGSDILLILINILKEMNIDEEVKIKYIRIINESYIKTCEGFDHNLQLYGCISRLVNTT